MPWVSTNMTLFLLPSDQAINTSTTTSVVHPSSSQAYGGGTLWWLRSPALVKAIPSYIIEGVLGGFEIEWSEFVVVPLKAGKEVVTVVEVPDEVPQDRGLEVEA